MKPVYESDQVTAYWDVPVCVDQKEVRVNRVEARFVDRGSKTVTLLEMSYPWVENRKQKEEEKTIVQTFLTQSKVFSVICI